MAISSGCAATCACDDGFRLRHRVGIAVAVDRVGLDRDPSDATASRRCSRRSPRRGMPARTRRSRCTPPGGCTASSPRANSGFVLARVDAVHRADVHAGGVLGLDTGVGDDEGHARESPSGVREVPEGCRTACPASNLYTVAAAQHNSDLSGRRIIYSVHDQSDRDADADPEPPDLSEKGGIRNGQPQRSNDRLFMQLLAFGGCADSPPWPRRLPAPASRASLYEDVNDPRGVGAPDVSARIPRCFSIACARC